MYRKRINSDLKEDEIVCLVKSCLAGFGVISPVTIYEPAQQKEGKPLGHVFFVGTNLWLFR